jgi:hypothetical protein
MSHQDHFSQDQGKVVDFVHFVTKIFQFKSQNQTMFHVTFHNCMTQKEIEVEKSFFSRNDFTIETT